MHSRKHVNTISEAIGENIMKFGEKLRIARIALNWAQIELGQKVGITERTIYKYEQEITSPKPDVLKKLAETLNVSVAYLLDDAETDKQKNTWQELFITNARNAYGSKGAREATAILSRTAALFAGGELNEDSKELFYQSLTEVYLESKAEAKSKFGARRRISPK
jgi:transcriptional regulator with XRE-family HTH domain